MPKTITITVSDSDYDALQAAAKNARQSPEELIVATIARRYRLQNSAPIASPEQEAREAVLAHMRASGHLVEFVDTPPGLKPHGCSVLRRSYRYASPKGLPGPLYVPCRVVVSMKTGSTVRAAMPADR